MGGAQILQYTISDEYDSDSQFSAENGLEFAVTFVGGDLSGKIDPRYGKLLFTREEYDESDDNIAIETYIESHDCSKAELGLDQASTKMMPMKQHAKLPTSKYSFTCIDSIDSRI